MATSFMNRLSSVTTDSRFRICMAGDEKGRDRREVMRFRKRRRFLQLSDAVWGPSTSVTARHRLSIGVGGAGCPPIGKNGLFEGVAAKGAHEVLVFAGGTSLLPGLDAVNDDLAKTFGLRSPCEVAFGGRGAKDDSPKLGIDEVL